jgi:hypothetical protein
MQPGVNFRVTDKKIERLVGVKDAATSNLAVRHLSANEPVFAHCGRPLRRLRTTAPRAQSSRHRNCRLSLASTGLSSLIRIRGEFFDLRKPEFYAMIFPNRWIEEHRATRWRRERNRIETLCNTT